MVYNFFKWGFWIRLNVKSRWVYFAFNPNYEPTFSERYGYRKVYILLGFVFKTGGDKNEK